MENTNDLVPVTSIPSPAITSTMLAGANISLVPFCLKCLPAFGGFMGFFGGFMGFCGGFYLWGFVWVWLVFFPTRLFSRSWLRHFFTLHTAGTQRETVYKTPTKHRAEPISTTLTLCCSQTHSIQAQMQHPTCIPEDFSSRDFVHATLSLRADMGVSQGPRRQLRARGRGTGGQKRSTSVCARCIRLPREGLSARDGARTVRDAARTSPAPVLPMASPFTSDNRVLVCN